jgi:hypothetical protein
MFGYQPSAEPNGVAKMEQMLAAISPGDPSPETAITLTTESGSHFAFETATRSFCGEFVEDAVELDNVSCAKCRRAMVALRKGGFVKTGMFACGAITRVGERCTRKPRADGYCTLHTDLAEAAA